MMSRFFRFHVSGDIPDAEYLNHMFAVAKRNPHCKILCFTKRYELVNAQTYYYREIGSKIPENLHIIYSAWVGLDMVNPFSFPEAHVRYKDGTTTAGPQAKECGGNCAECAKSDGGCWSLKSGEQIIFNEH